MNWGRQQGNFMPVVNESHAREFYRFAERGMISYLAERSRSLLN